MDKLRTLKVFIQVAEKGSFTSAAKQVGLSPSAVSKAMSQLEDELQVSLFDRSTREFRLTKAGETYYESVSQCLSELKNTESSLLSQRASVKGSLILNVPVTYGRRYIIPFLYQFKNAFPEISIEVRLSDGYLSNINSDYDLSIRSGTIDDSSLIARQLSPMDFGICASPDFFEKFGVPKTYNELKKLPWIGFRFSETGKVMPIRMSDGRCFPIDKSAEFIVNDGESMVDLAVKGFGLIQSPHFILKDALDAGALRLLYPTMRHPEMCVYAIYSKSSFVVQKIKTFVEAFQDYLREKDEGAYETWMQQTPSLVASEPS